MVFYDVILTIVTQHLIDFTACITVVGSGSGKGFTNHCAFYVLPIPFIDYIVDVGYTDKDYLSIEPRESGGYHGP